ncbi:2-carboxy-1,4-naphthoquinone phytyltransferase, chloroplastic-like protein [Drosera capensis]
MASLGSLAPLSTIYNINNCYKPSIGTSGFSLGKIKCCHEKKNSQRCIRASADGKTQHFQIAKEQMMGEVSQPMLVWRAIKLPIYSVALVPLTVASAAAYLHTGNFSARRYFGCLASSIFIIAWLNLSNDVYDFDTGADKNKKESVVNMVGSRTGTLVAANLLLALGSVGLTLIAVEAGTFRSMLLLASAIFCGYVYQCPPARLSYHGLGEPLCFAAFGPFATTAFYLMQSSQRNLYSLHSFMGTIVSASILVGYTTSLILFCSHFHQVEGDVAVGKISPLVRIGTEMGSEVVKISVAILYLLLFAFGLGGALPLVAIVFCGLTLPMGYMVTNYVKQNYNVRSSNSPTSSLWKEPARDTLVATGVHDPKYLLRRSGIPEGVLISGEHIPSASPLGPLD